MEVELCILGSSSALATDGKRPSAQLLKMEHTYFLFDCGEACQFTLREQHHKPHKISHIFITHLHGDHYFGLFGLLSSFRLQNRTTPIRIHAPTGLKAQLISVLNYEEHSLGFPIEVHEHDASVAQPIYEDEKIQVRTIPLLHRKPCTGYAVHSKHAFNHLDAEALETYHIPFDQRALAQKGLPVVDRSGVAVPLEKLIKKTRPPWSYAYITDTAYFPELASSIGTVQWLYHEATFDENDRTKAQETLHSTTLDAARIALQCPAQSLLIGHFSSRYKDEIALLEEAQSIFENTHLAQEGATFRIN